MIRLAEGTRAVVTDWLGDKFEVEVVHFERDWLGFVTYWVRYDDRDGLYPFTRDELAVPCLTERLFAAIAQA
jgi:hypothetical protein